MFYLFSLRLRRHNRNQRWGGHRAAGVGRIEQCGGVAAPLPRTNIVSPAASSRLNIAAAAYKRIDAILISLTR